MCCHSVLIDMASLTQGFDSIMWAPVEERREAEELSQKVPHVFSESSPTQSKWLYVV